MIKDAAVLWNIFKRRYPSGISRTDIVLDIGSGHRPHPRADILVEKFVEDARQRGGPVVTWRLPLVIADVTSLPFANNAIDFIVCSHVLEHMETSTQLEQALQELIRVGKRGYIETPSSTFEKLLGAPYHHWYVRRQGRRIIFTRKKNYREYEDLMRAFLPLHRDSKTFFRILHENFDLFYVSLEWSGKIDYLIENVTGETETELGKDYPADLASGFHSLGEKLQREHFVRMIVKRAIRTFVGRNASTDLFRMLACPVCKRNINLGQDQQTLSCASCRLEFPISNGVPIMLMNKATKF